MLIVEKFLLFRKEKYYFSIDLFSFKNDEMKSKKLYLVQTGYLNFKINVYCAYMYHVCISDYDFIFYQIKIGKKEVSVCKGGFMMLHNVKMSMLNHLQLVLKTGDYDESKLDKVVYPYIEGNVSQF